MTNFGRTISCVPWLIYWSNYINMQYTIPIAHVQMLWHLIKLYSNKGELPARVHEAMEQG